MLPNPWVRQGGRGKGSRIKREMEKEEKNLKEKEEEEEEEEEPVGCSNKGVSPSVVAGHDGRNSKISY